MRREIIKLIGICSESGTGIKNNDSGILQQIWQRRTTLKVSFFTIGWSPNLKLDKKVG